MTVLMGLSIFWNHPAAYPPTVQIYGFLPLPPCGGLGKAPMIIYELGAFQQGILSSIKYLPAFWQYVPLHHPKDGHYQKGSLLVALTARW